LVFSNSYRGGGTDYACNKISFYGGENTPTTTSSFGFGVAAEQLEYFSYSHHVFNTGTRGGTTYGSERMRIASNGNIGIGTNNPFSALHLHTNATTTETRMILSDNTTTASGSRGLHLVKVGNADGYLMNYENNPLIFGTNGSERMCIASNGNIGIGTNNPGFRLEVASASVSAGSFTGWQLWSNAPSVYTGSWDSMCAKFNGGVWSTHYFMASSDSRIKEDIQDINDDNALQSILSIEPKTYKYVDKLERGDKRVYGFIAQQIRDIIPEAVKIEKSYIPNIYSVTDYNNNVITLPSQPTKVVIKVDDKIKCYDKDNKEILVEVIEVIDSLTFRINEIEYSDTKILVYGTEVDDFHILDKTYIFTLNVCATQELHRRIEAQNLLIKSQDDRIKDLETKMERLLSGTT
jgi:hypothetical protein